MPNETPKPKSPEPKIFHMDANGNLVEGAPDSETLHRMLQAKLAEESKATGVAPRPAPPTPAPKTPVRRYGPNGKTEREMTDEAETGKGETMRDAINKGVEEAGEH